MNVTASIITIANVILAILDIPTINEPSPRRPDLPIRYTANVILFLVLESLFAYFFSKLVFKVNKKAKDEFVGFMIVAIIILGLLSCWTSVFNIEWLIVKDGWTGFAYYASLILGCIISNSIVALFLMSEECDFFYAEDFLQYSVAHGLGFVVIAILLALD